MSIGPAELAVIVLLFMLLFGAKRFAELGKGIGEGIRGFKRGISGEIDPAPSTASSSNDAEAQAAKATSDATAAPSTPEQPGSVSAVTKARPDTTDGIDLQTAERPAASPTVEAPTPEPQSSGAGQTPLASIAQGTRSSDG